MSVFILKIVKFISILIIYAGISMACMPYIISIQHGPDTKEQISRSFSNVLKTQYETLILGNSRIYRGINPDLFELDTYNFAHDNDSYNQIFYKLKYLLDRKVKFKHLILGTDYFQFSFKSGSRNYVYADYLDSEYLEDFDSNATLQKIRYYLGNANPKKLFNLRPSTSNPYLKENGQYLKHGKARPEDSVERDINRLKLQVEYFEKIIELCKLNHFNLFIVMPPTRKKELTSYTDSQMNEFSRFIHSYVDGKRSFYLDYSKSELFSLKDYTDITHLNEHAANLFSEVLNKDISNIIKRLKPAE